jgi:dihydrofolate reductase
MGSSVLYMSMSLDGFIAGPNETMDHGLGDGGMRLHEWIFAGAKPGEVDPSGEHLTGANKQIWDEMMATGAVVAGRGTFEPARGWGGDHHNGVPIYILSRHPAPEWAARWPLVHYVNDLGVAMQEAKRAASTRDVLVHGAGITQRALPAGLLDEIQIHLVPVLMGQGRRLFEGMDAKQRELQRVRVLEGDGVTHLRYRVR